MIRFFKNLIKKEPKEATISLDEVPAFIEEHTTSTKRNAESLESYFEKLNMLFPQLKEHLKGLERAELKNKKIDKRILNVMEGNRNAYIKKAEFFVNSCKLPKSGSPESITEFIEKYKENIGYFNKNTAKAFYVLKEFFGDNMKSIGQNLKQIDEVFVSLQKLMDNVPSQIMAKINEHIQEIKEINEKEASINEEIKNKEEILKNLKGELESINNLIKIKKKSDAFLSVSSKTEEKERCEEEIKDVHNLIVQAFSPLSSSFRKLKHLSEDDKAIDNYLSDPVFSLKKDTNLDILKILNSLKSKIENDEIQIKDKKREITLQAIEQISKNYLTEVKNTLTKLEKKKSELNSSIISNSTIREISEMTYKIDHMGDKVSRQEDINSLKRGLSKYDKNSILKEIEKDLSKLTDINVTLTF